MNDQNTGYFFTVGFKPYRVSLLLLKINSNWDWTKFGKKKLRSAYLVNYLLMRKIPLPRNLFLTQTSQTVVKIHQSFLKKIKTLANMTPVRHQCLQLQKNFENFLFFSGFPRATENPSLSII